MYITVTQDGIKKDIDPKNLEINGLPLINWLQDMVELKKEFKSFEFKINNREKELQKLWGRIK